MARPGHTARASATSLKDVIIIVTEIYFVVSRAQRQTLSLFQVSGDRGSVSF